MKRTGIKTNKFSLLVAVVLTMTFFACNDENVVSVQSDTVLDEISDDVELETSYEEVDDLALAGAEYDFSTSGKSEADGRFDCAELTKVNTDDGVIITIDFGDGCEGPNGKEIAGILKITKSGNHWIPGSVMSVELIGFSINEVDLEGIRTVTNISESIDDAPVFSIILAGGKATWPDGRFATREVDRTRTLIRGANPLGDEIHVEGVASGTSREGNSYEVLILERLVFKRSCRGSKKFIPVSGVKQITKGDKVIIIDFGDGTCDNLATMTVGGVTTEITINPRRFKNK